MKTKMIFRPRNFILYLVGCIAIAIGVVFMVRSEVGTSSWDSLHFSLSELATISMGMATIVVALIFTVAVIILNKSFRYLIMAVPIFLVGFLIDFFGEVVLVNWYPEVFGLQIMSFVIGAILLPLGGSMLIVSTFPAGIFDEFNLAMMRVFNTNKLVLIRVIMELLAVATALLLGYFANIGMGNVKLGTLVFSLIVGKEIKLYLTLFERIGYYENKQND